jgi:predicted NAD/FAD-binding protein
MLGEVVRFHRHARRVLDDERAGDVTLGAFLAIGGYSRYFTEHFMLPVVACVWSAGEAVSMSYPARYLFTFLDHHGMLSVTGSPTWRTVTGGSRTYVDLLAKELTTVRTATPVRSIARTAGGVDVRDENGEVSHHDAVVVATHADQALALLEDPTDLERRTLGAFGYSRNSTVLHLDHSQLPRSEGARACWNYRLPGCAPSSGPPRVTYDMNRLQHLDAKHRYLVSLNADIPESRVLARMTYEHPVYTPESVQAQGALPRLNDDRTAYAGAYHGWGFHEDGCRSGVAAARSLGVNW